MLKGHAKIELTNINTGKTETYEHDNLITRAVSEQIATMAKMSSYTDVNNKFLPLHDKAMGGILLLSSTQENKSTEMLLEPKGIVGYASNNASPGTDSKRGSRNLIESGLSEDGKSYKFVWDFSTSQANGTISALALTSAKCGKLPYSNRVNPDSTATDGFYFIRQSISGTAQAALPNAVDFDFSTNIATCVYLTSTTSVNVAKVRIPIDEIRLNTSLLTPEVISLENIDFSDTGISVNANANIISVGDYYYMLYSTSSAKAISAWRIDKATMTIDENYGDSGKMDISLALGEDASGAIVYAKTVTNKTTRTAVAVDNNVFIAYGDYVLIINPSNGTLVNYKTVPSSVAGTLYASGVMHFDTEGLAKRSYLINSSFIVEASLTGNDFIIKDSPKNNSLLIPSAGYQDRAVFINDNGIILCIANDDILIGSTMDYMATINNLDTSIIKTAAQSMKITYTLTEVGS